MTIEEQLTRDEGLRLRPYIDTVGKWTIGVGRNLSDRGITAQEARILLEHDIEICEQELEFRLPWAPAMDPERWFVLVNMCFNLGITRLLGFKKALAAMQLEAWELAAKEMLDSKWASQVGDRAKRLAKQIVTAEWQ